MQQKILSAAFVFATFETRDIATRPATRHKVRDCIRVPLKRPTSRPSRASDLPAITAIYAHHVLQGTGTFEIDPPTESEMAARRDDVLTKNLPYLVAVDAQGQVLGYAYANWF